MAGNMTSQAVGTGKIDNSQAFKSFGIGVVANVALAGADVGSVVPVAGAFFGAVVGFAVGYAYSYITEKAKYRNQSLKEWSKQGLYNLVN